MENLGRKKLDQSLKRKGITISLNPKAMEKLLKIQTYKRSRYVENLILASFETETTSTEGEAIATEPKINQ